METFLAEISKNYPGIIPIAVLILVIMAIVKDPSIISKISKLARRTPKEIQQQEAFGNFKLIKLNRLSRMSRRVEGFFGVFFAAYFGFIVFCLFLILTIMPNTASVWLRIFLYVGFTVLSAVWIDMLTYKTSIIKSQFNCDPVQLFAFCYKYLLNRHLTITEFEGEARTITAWLGDIELKIEIHTEDNGSQEMRVIAKRPFLSVLFYSNKYLKFIDTFIYQLCYPKN